MLEWIRENVPMAHLVGTVAFVAVVVLLRWTVTRRIRSSEIPPEIKRRSIVQTRNASVLVILFGGIVIWASQLHTVAISALAIAAAIVIATKELIMCLTGTIVRLSGRSFEVGDRIEVGTYRGDVIDQTLLTTTLMEVGPGNLTHQHTGRALVLPNSLFLTTTVANETFTDAYVLHLFVVPMKITDDWQKAREVLLEAARRASQPYLDDAKAHIESRTKPQGLDTPSLNPRITLRFPDPERVDLMVRIPAPSPRRGRVEQEILNAFALQRPKWATPISSIDTKIREASDSPDEKV